MDEESQFVRPPPGWKGFREEDVTCVRLPGLGDKHVSTCAGRGPDHGHVAGALPVPPDDDNRQTAGGRKAAVLFYGGRLTAGGDSSRRRPRGSRPSSRVTVHEPHGARMIPRASLTGRQPSTTFAALNLPNALTVLRIFLVPLLVVVLLTRIEGHVYLGTGIFLVAVLTDYLDGFFARRRNEVTRLGMREAHMETIADFMARILIERRAPEDVAEDVIEFRLPYQKFYYCFDNGLPA